MRVFVNAFGSQGDIQPFVALGVRLLRAGHRVTICTCERFRPLVESHGLCYGFVSDELLELIDTDAARKTMDGGKLGWWEYLGHVYRLALAAGPIQTRALRASWAACEAAAPDVVVYHPKAVGAPHFAERLGVPAVLVLLQPVLVPTAAFPLFLAPDLALGSWTGAYNRQTYAVLNALAAAGARPYARAWRASMGMAADAPARAQPPTQPDGAPALTLHAYSPLVLARPSDWPPTAVVSGYWPLSAAKDWRPSRALADFLAAGPPPVYVGFGSMAGDDPAGLFALVVGALAAAGRRGVVATGWGGLRAPHDAPPSVFVLREPAPHEWLFARVAAVVHHGGAGTTAAGLRAGRPAVVCPFFADQPLWAARVHALGVGAEPLPQRRLSAATLGAAITLVVTDAGIRARAAALGERLRAEDGAGETVARLEALVAEAARARGRLPRSSSGGEAADSGCLAGLGKTTSACAGGRRGADQVPMRPDT